MFTKNHKIALLKYSRAVIKAKLKSSELEYTLPHEAVYEKKYGAFVTLHKNGGLRGCVGYIKAFKPLRETIHDMSIAAAFNDTRFEPLQISEFDDIDIEISILSELVLIKSIDEIKIGRDGLFMKNGYKSGLLLPQVATEYQWDKETFLDQTCNKGRMRIGCWKHPLTETYRFTAEIFSEDSEKQFDNKI